MMSYKCSKCGHIFEGVASSLIRCPECANKIFFKARQPVKKEVKAN